MKKIIKIFKPNLKLVRGTRLSSALFIGASIALAAGIIFGANIYYDIDTSKIMVENTQQATTTQVTTNTGSTSLTVTQRGAGAAFLATSTSAMTSDIFKITNLGSGKSFVVEDQDSDTVSAFVIDTNGNVGVASSTPSAALGVQGNVMIANGILSITTTTATSTLAGPLQIAQIKITGPITPVDGYVLTATDVLGNAAWEAVPTGVWTDASPYIYPTNWSSRDVAIATTTARYDLDVWGNASFGTTTDYAVPLLLVNSNATRVGIATTTPSAELAVNGSIYVKGNLSFSGDRTISGNGTLTIAPSGTLYLFSTTNSIDSSGNMILAGYASSTKVISPELEYSGNITIDANSAGNTTVSVTNQGDGLADLSVEGDITVTGGKVTFGNGQTVDAETSGRLILTPGVYIDGNATVTDVFYASNQAKITGNVTITSGNLTVQGDILPQAAGSGYTLGDSSTYWDNLYAATTTIGSTASQLVIDVDDIRAPGVLTISSTGGGLIFQPAAGYNATTTLSGAGKFYVGSTGQFYIDASGNVTTTGSIYAAGGFRTGTTDATVRKSGEEIVRGVAPIFGFDLPARCNTSCNSGTATATISRVIENADDIFPNPYSGTTRKFRFSIRYADATTTAATRTTWDVATSSDPTYVNRFTLPPTDSADLAKGFTTTTNQVVLPVTTGDAGDDWFLRVSTGGSGNYDLQVYEILLIGIDQVN